ncbi:unnamed protein product [Meganyctiphanes norvegica]|uniref:Elongation of very long chain fatty acids protein n=1 Tax=Meganyctiphanes norvegica TaxID=48144 RepID=A0AAV2QHZ8_MEGNR
MNKTMESVTMPNYSYVFTFEEDFDGDESRKWFAENWTMSFYYISAYMLVIFGLQQYMASRPRFELRGYLVTWNIFLAVFSLWGTYRSAPELLYVLQNYGFRYSCCIPGPSAFIQLGHNVTEQSGLSPYYGISMPMIKTPQTGLQSC